MEPVNEENPHGHADGALADAERAKVEAHLRAHPEDAAPVEAHRQRNDALHRAFDAVLGERHRLAVGAPAQPRWPRWRFAAALAATFVGAVLGALLHAAWSPDRGETGASVIAPQAAIAHAADLPEVRHPGDVAASDEQHLAAWLSKWLDSPDAGAVAYRRRLSLAWRPAAAARRRSWRCAGGPFHVRKRAGQAAVAARAARGERKGNGVPVLAAGATNVIDWIDGPPGYALAEQINREELEAVSLVVYWGLNRERSFLAAGRLLSRTSGLRRLWVHVKGADTYLPRP
jgi:anti-sigma factor RsiW